MFDITRSDLAWGTGIACAAAAAIFFVLIGNSVNSTAKVVVSGRGVIVRVAGVVTPGYMPGVQDPEEAGDLADLEEAKERLKVQLVAAFGDKK